MGQDLSEMSLQRVIENCKREATRDCDKRQRALSPKVLSTETKTLFLELLNCDPQLRNWSLSFSFLSFFFLM